MRQGMYDPEAFQRFEVAGWEQKAADDEFSGLLRAAGLERVTVQRLAFAHRVSSPDALWDGWLAASVRTSALILGQPEATQRHIRAAFERLIQQYVAGGGFELPISVKVASGRKAGGRQ